MRSFLDMDILLLIFFRRYPPWFAWVGLFWTGSRFGPFGFWKKRMEWIWLCLIHSLEDTLLITYVSLIDHLLGEYIPSQRFNMDIATVDVLGNWLRKPLKHFDKLSLDLGCMYSALQIV
jgi:hypothetical protein